jgi:YidC/Oxa1 family membrane protein insertase
MARLRAWLSRPAAYCVAILYAKAGMIPFLLLRKAFVRTMDKKAILAVVLSMVIWIGWQKYYLEPIQQRNAAVQKAEQEAQASANKRDELKADLDAKGIISPAEKSEIASRARQFQNLENDSTNVLVTNSGAAIEGWQLKGFSPTLEKKDVKIGLEGATGFSNQLSLRFNDANMSAEVARNWDSLERTGDRGVVAKLSAPSVQAEKQFVLDEKGYGATLQYKLRFTNAVPTYVFLDLFGSPKREHDTEGSIFGQAPDKVHVTFRDPQGRHAEIAASYKETKESASGVKWMGLDTRYFVLAAVPTDASKDAGAQVAQDNSRGAPAVRGTLVFPTNGAKEMTVSTRVFFGPKDMESLRAVDPILTDTIDFGWTSFLAIPLLQALKWLYTFVHNYGLAIIILTFLIKMALLPLTYKSMKSMSKIAKLQPQLNALREKYKDDREKLNVEMMTFMKTNGYNPVGGCLPILIQMPIFFALYRVLFNSMELYQAPFGLWIHDLSSPDPLFITPVLLCGLMFLQQKLSPTTATDPTQQKMMQIMPVIFGVFMLMLPAGLNVYMVVNSATSIAQQLFLNKKLGIGRYAPKDPVKV